MRAVLGLILLASALAEDKLYCSTKCAQKYDEGDIRDACNVGCEGRASSSGPFEFLDCQRNCDNKFSRDNESTSEARSACGYACMLPTTSSVFMSVKYSNGGKPEVKIVRSDNGITSVEHPKVSSAGDLNGFMSRIFGDANHRILPFGNPLELVKPVSDAQERKSVEQQNSFSSPDLSIGSAHARMIAMQERMNEIVNTFTRQFFDGIRRHMQRHHHLAGERPTEHDAFAHFGPEVGNLLSNGEPIIFTYPVDSGDDADDQEHSVKAVRYQTASSHPPSVFYWIMIVFGVGALLLTLYASVIFFRVMRSAAYRRISADPVPPSRCPAAPPAPAGPLPVKKVPLDGWVEHSKPSGVPPPAYDQVSIHSIQKQQQAEAAEPVISAPSNESPPPGDKM